MGKIIAFNPVQNYGSIPTEPIKPNDVTFMGCSYDEQLHPVLLIQTSEKEYSIRLGKAAKYHELHSPLETEQVNEIIAYLRENGLLYKNNYSRNQYTLMDLAGAVWISWRCIRIMQHLQNTYQCEITNLFPLSQLLVEHPTTKTLLKYVDEKHIPDFKSFLSTFRKEKWFAYALEEKHYAIYLKRTGKVNTNPSIQNTCCDCFCK